MALGKHDPEQQRPLFIASSELIRSPGHPFYRRLNELLAEHDFDRFAEDLCARFYAPTMGRPSLPPGEYFRMLLVGFFEGLSSERGIAWRCSDSRSLCEFLGLGPDERVPDHSTLSKTRKLLDVQTHSEIFGWVLALVAKHGVLKGKTVGIDASTLEANAAMRSIVRRDSGQSYDDYLTELAQSSGIETPTREDKARIDRQRPGKASNAEWESATDTDARIAKMKDGRTHMAYKLEHAVDFGSSAIVGVTVQPADRGDTTSVYETLEEASEQLKQAHGEGDVIEETVLDKGYHSNDVLADCAELDVRTYASEPKRGKRRWVGKPEAQAAVYANRRRIQGARGKALLRRRGELVERSFAHTLETGGMRRVHVRGFAEVTKRMLAVALAFNLGLLMRVLTGIGTPRSLQGQAGRLLAAFCAHLRALVERIIAPGPARTEGSHPRTSRLIQLAAA
jgi:transposase